VDDVTFDPEGNLEDFGNADESGGGAWVDDEDDDEDDSRPQCAQQ